jgi:hypothetical protein
MKKQQMQQLFIQFINYVWYLLHVSALHCHPQGAFLMPSMYAHHITRYNTPIHNILSTAPQLIISQMVIGTLPDDGNVMPKHAGGPYIINKLNGYLLHLLVLHTYFYWGF